jgi:hypothetical protein
MKMSASDVGGSNRLPVPGVEEKSGFAPTNEFLQHGRDHWMKVNFPNRNGVKQGLLSNLGIRQLNTPA